jgi:hypothetical protein
MIRAAALALLASPAAAQDVCSFGLPDRPRTEVGIAASAEPGVWAEIEIANQLATRVRRVCILTLDHETVRVIYDAGDGALPDLFRVEPPPGYIAEPPEVIVPDGSGATIRIRRADVGPMG